MRRAREEGRQFFVARYWDEMIAFQGTGSIGGAAETIEAVEDEGWRLVHTVYSWVESENRDVQVLTFRRADRAVLDKPPDIEVDEELPPDVWVCLRGHRNDVASDRCAECGRSRAAVVWEPHSSISRTSPQFRSASCTRRTRSGWRCAQRTYV